MYRGEPFHQDNTSYPQEPGGYLRQVAMQLLPGDGLTLRSTAPRDPNRGFTLDNTDRSGGPDVFYLILHAFYTRY